MDVSAAVAMSCRMGTISARSKTSVSVIYQVLPCTLRRRGARNSVTALHEFHLASCDQTSREALVSAHVLGMMFWGDSRLRSSRAKPKALSENSQSLQS